uniref:Cyclosome subunit 8 n=1 Tax=Strigamia maritima TaxID=126957 RepID=T1JH63_STRMM
MALISSSDFPRMKIDVIKANKECSDRGLIHSAKWAAELSHALKNVNINVKEVVSSLGEEEEKFYQDFDDYVLAKSYFELKEYERAADFTGKCISQKAKFLHLYSLYLAGEKQKNDDISDTMTPGEVCTNLQLRRLRSEMQQEHSKLALDGFGLYLYGVVLKKLDLISDAVVILTEAIHSEPLHWGSWLELATLVIDKDMLTSLLLPDSWMKQFFLAHTYLELQLNEDALVIYNALTDAGLSESTYIMAQIAIAYHNMRDVDQAVNIFRKLQKVDPFRLDNMDTYSNLLYVKELRVELSFLAHRACDIDKYRVETCCVVGNYYSLRSQHEKAVLYFQRALKLNPHYLAAWTLMGHEYMEMKNTAAAIQSYRQAIEVNRRDYRAWYGLGQTYEILKMNYYCSYYYRQAQQLRPNDSRMLVALGESYEKLDRLKEAKKCFWKAHSVGDIEGLALIKLAKLYAKLGEDHQAASAYSNYIHEVDETGIQNVDRDELCHAYKYLANHCLKQKDLDGAYTNAQKCTEYNETREEGKSIIRQIAQLRTQTDIDMNDSRYRTKNDSLHAEPMNLTFTQ